MPLQGTIDSFPLADVLSLLDSTAQVGRLNVLGDFNSGWVEIAEGFITSAELTHGRVQEPLKVVLELLRCNEGEFEFIVVDSAELSASMFEPILLSACLEESAQRLKCWEEIELVLPSLSHQIQLRGKLSVSEVKVDSFQWSVLAAIHGCSAISEVIDRMNIDDLEVCTGLANLINQDLAILLGPVTDELKQQNAVDLIEVLPVTEDSHLEIATFTTSLHEDFSQTTCNNLNGIEMSSFPDHFPIDELLGSTESESAEIWHSDERSLGSVYSDSEHHSVEQSAAAAAWDELVTAAPPLLAQESSTAQESPAIEAESQPDVYQQMSTLSPQAAAAIAVALSASTQFADQTDEKSPLRTIVEVELAAVDSSSEIAESNPVKSEFETASSQAGTDESVGPISFIGSF